MLKACFWLIAVIIAAVMTVVLLTGAICVVGIWQGRFPLGTCRGDIETILQEWWAAALAAIFALLAIARGPPGPPPPPEE
jgi:hypothetical protein